MTEAARPAGFWLRAVALAIDLIVFALVQMSFGVVATLVFGAGVKALPAFARVVDVAGEPLRLGTSFLRYLGYWASTATLGFGYLMAALRRDKRALHDLIAGTRVERFPPRSARPAGTEPAAPAASPLGGGAVPPGPPVGPA
jgi:uncharacterized RDD family membrane protein YckC